MELIRWMVIILFGSISAIPVIRLRLYKETDKYLYLRYFVNAIFVWTILTFLIHALVNLTMVYYVSLLVYPLVFSIVYLGYETVQSFIDKKTKDLIKLFAFIYLITNISLVLTNNLHEWVKNITSHTITDRDSIIFAEYGPFFMIHLIISYVFVVVILIKLIIHLKNNANTNENFIPYTLLLLIMGAGLVINIVHVFIYTFHVDPTYLFIVAFGYYLYWIVFTKDFQLRLLRGSRNELINAMREMYIIAEMNGEVVEYSKKLDEHFNLNPDITRNLNTFLRYLNKKSVLYRTFDHIKDEPYQDKRYFYTVSKDFDIPGFDRRGILVLLYDETRLMKLVDQLNYALKYDTMTNLFNRNHFDNNYDLFEEKHQDCGVIITDINGLKLYNDYLGHRAGDKLIKTYAAILKSLDDKHTHVFRFGGDEFLIYLEKSTLTLLKDIEERLVKLTESTSFPTKASISIGYAQRRKDENLDTLINRADKELYKQKDTNSPAFQKQFLEWIAQKNN